MRALPGARREVEAGAARACVTVCRRVGVASGYHFVDLGAALAGMDRASSRVGDQPIFWRAR
jgi:hypothetical protein